MNFETGYHPLTCAECAAGAGLGFEFSMAFQPIVDIANKTIFSYEALVRGPNGEPAHSVLSQVDEKNRYRFDQSCRVKAIKTAAELDIMTSLNINFFPNAVYQPETCIRTTLQAANDYAFPVGKIIFEVTEGEQVSDPTHLDNIIKEYKHRGFLTAIDDFGAGYAGLNLLSEFQPDYVKLDMALTRSIQKDRIRRAIVNSIIQVCRELGIEIIAEGIETEHELAALRDLGLTLFQGYFFAHPAFEALPQVDFLNSPNL